MNIIEIAEYVWAHCTLIHFGDSHVWDEKLFTVAWAKAGALEKMWNEMGPGWYWFSTKVTYAELHDVARPPTLPENGCDIGNQTHVNCETFGAGHLCAPEDSWLVVYNGHEKNIAQRVRSHFSLKNNKTGALGLKHYPLSAREWRVHLFSTSSFGTDIVFP
jgi:hypothetical protein